MITQSDFNSDAAPRQAEVQKIGFWRGNESWTPIDLANTLKAINPILANFYGTLELGRITYGKLLQWINSGSVSFDEISDVIRLCLKHNVTPGQPLFIYCTMFEPSNMCDFLKMLVKEGQNDNRYYSLIYEILVYQHVTNYSTPLASQLEQVNGFMEEVFGVLPSDMQDNLQTESYYQVDDNNGTGRMICYKLLGGGSVSME